MLWQIVLCLVIFWLFVDHFYRKYIHRSMRSIPEVDLACFPFIGHAHIFIGSNKDRMDAFKRLADISTRLGGVTTLWFCRRLFLNVTDTSQADELLKVFLAKDDLMEIMWTLSGTGSIWAPVPLWRSRRKLLVPTFSSHNLKHFLSVFAEGSDTMVRKLGEDCTGRPHKMLDYLATYSLDSACKTTLGINLQLQRNPGHPFITAVGAAFKYLGKRVCQPWLQVDWIYELLPQHKRLQESKGVMFNFINEIIKARRIQRKQESENKIGDDQNPGAEPKRIRSFMDIMLDLAEMADGISNEELRDESLVIIGAGTDTTAVGIGFVLTMLARHPDVQMKAFEEIERVFGKSKPILSISSRNLMDLRYVDAVIRETLRLYPPAPVIVRKVDSYEKLSTLPSLVPGMGVLINIWGIHRNPKYWGPDAEEFMPERFLDNSVRHPAAFMPFSSGPRNCIGYQYAMLSMKIVITNIIRNYHISLPNDCHLHGLSSQRTPDCTSCKVEPIKAEFDILMKDHNEFNLKLERRT